jgi:uncharacterized membrane protein required for colicin V production
MMKYIFNLKNCIRIFSIFNSICLTIFYIMVVADLRSSFTDKYFGYVFGLVILGTVLNVLLFIIIFLTKNGFQNVQEQKRYFIYVFTNVVIFICYLLWGMAYDG